MPYASEKIKLSKEQDRRIKLYDEQREEIRDKYNSGLYSKRCLASEYHVSRRLIDFVVDDEKRKKCAEQFKERRSDGRYKQSKEERNKTMREHRKYKHDLYIEGKLKEEKSDLIPDRKLE